MGYLLPLTFVKVSNKRSDNREFDVAIPCTRIVAIMSTEIHQARKTLTAEKRSGTLINAAGTERAKSAIFLDNGSVISSPLSVNRLMTAIEKANQKADPKMNKQMRVYDVIDEEDDDADFDDEDEDD